jgi:hypothetical protein
MAVGAGMRGPTTVGLVMLALVVWRRPVVLAFTRWHALNGLGRPWSTGMGVRAPEPW